MAKSPKGQIDPEVAEEMRAVGRSIADSLPPGWGFCLLTFELGTDTGNTNYISNANRKDMIVALEEFLHHAKEGDVAEGPPSKKKRH